MRPLIVILYSFMRLFGRFQGLITVTVGGAVGPLSGFPPQAPFSAITKNNITSMASDNMTVTRSFTIQSYSLSIMEVNTISGFPTGPLAEGCGYADAQPAQEAKVRMLLPLNAFPLLQIRQRSL
jgi:hypothetical protein